MLAKFFRDVKSLAIERRLPGFPGLYGYKSIEKSPKKIRVNSGNPGNLRSIEKFQHSFRKNPRKPASSAFY
jgi:hypothetical protein